MLALVSLLLGRVCARAREPGAVAKMASIAASNIGGRLLPFAIRLDIGELIALPADYLAVPRSWLSRPFFDRELSFFEDRIHFRAYQQGEAGDKNPHHEHKKRADRAVALVVVAHVAYIEIHSRGSQHEHHGGKERPGSD